MMTNRRTIPKTTYVTRFLSSSAGFLVESSGSGLRSGPGSGPVAGVGQGSGGVGGLGGG